MTMTAAQARRYRASRKRRGLPPIRMSIEYERARHEKRKADPIEKAKRAAQARIRYRNAEDQKKIKARAKARWEIRAGRLRRQPCERCGTEQAQIHHENYDKPLDVRWLCRKCHAAEHGIIFREPPNARVGTP